MEDTLSKFIGSLAFDRRPATRAHAGFELSRGKHETSDEATFGVEDVGAARLAAYDICARLFVQIEGIGGGVLEVFESLGNRPPLFDPPLFSVPGAAMRSPTGPFNGLGALPEDGWQSAEDLSPTSRRGIAGEVVEQTVEPFHCGAGDGTRASDRHAGVRSQPLFDGSFGVWQASQRIEVYADEAGARVGLHDLQRECKAL